MQHSLYSTQIIDEPIETNIDFKDTFYYHDNVTRTLDISSCIVFLSFQSIQVHLHLRLYGNKRRHKLDIDNSENNPAGKCVFQKSNHG